MAVRDVVMGAPLQGQWGDSITRLRSDIHLRAPHMKASWGSVTALHLHLTETLRGRSPKTSRVKLKVPRLGNSEARLRRTTGNDGKHRESTQHDVLHRERTRQE